MLYMKPYTNEDKKDIKHAKEFFVYFQNKHTEKQLDNWIKVLLPMIQNNDFANNKKLKYEIMRGTVPMCYRGQLWAQLIGNQEKINLQIYEKFKNTDYTFTVDWTQQENQGTCRQWL